jgi:4a-hydroxytetrahydrobiopterin dehydratase
MQPLHEQEIRRRLAAIPGWDYTGRELRRVVELDGFPAAIAFVQRVAALAEEADHHPDIDIRFDTVVLALRTHSAHGITGKDFDLAGRIDGLGTGR